MLGQDSGPIRNSPAGIDNPLRLAEGWGLDGAGAIFAGLGSVRLAYPPRCASRVRRRGEISFCNEFPHTLYIAIAYEEYENNYVSRGWLQVETGKCYVFDTAIRVNSFYYCAVSEPYREGKHKVKTRGASIGNSRSKTQTSRPTMPRRPIQAIGSQGSPRAPNRAGGPVTAIVTFTETGGSTITIPAPEKPETGGGSPQAAPQPAQESTTPTPPSSEGGIQDK
jgi:hypothetical protein